MSLYHVKSLLFTPALIPGPWSFLGAFPPPRLLSPLHPIPPLPLPSPFPPKNIYLPDPTTNGTPSPPDSERNAHRGPESVASQYTVRPCYASLWCISQSPLSLLPPVLLPKFEDLIHVQVFIEDEFSLVYHIFRFFKLFALAF